MVCIDFQKLGSSLVCKDLAGLGEGSSFGFRVGFKSYGGCTEIYMGMFVTVGCRGSRAAGRMIQNDNNQDHNEAKVLLFLFSRSLHCYIYQSSLYRASSYSFYP